MLEKVSKTIKKYSMAENGERILCCLSGGADSVALLLCLMELGFDILACHINHQLRGEESYHDERFCIELCGYYGIPVTVHRIDVNSYCEQHGVSVEQGAREMRYEIFSASGCDKIATAHTLSDCIETALFNFARGTGITGLCSIPPVRDNIIRPLIECSRSEIESFLNEREQPWVTDSTNLTDEYTRNRIRHNIVPQLYEINPSLDKTMNGTFDNLREDMELLNRLSDTLYSEAMRDGGLDCETVLSADSALSGRVIRGLLEKNGVDPSRDMVLRVKNICREGGKLSVGKDIYAEVKDGVLRIVGEAESLPDTEIKAVSEGEYHFFDKSVHLIVENHSNVHKKITNFDCDYDKIKGVIVIRNRRPGDKLRLGGRDFTSDVKKLLQSRFRSEERRKAVILADDEGVIFVEGYGFAKRVLADSSTKAFLFCKIS